ncbi:hypothetical protein [Nocardioides nanhaiensis]|uniref:Integral membrane protein n=1 Tax=Nocardioides nanhaiensis TaxID=1476871 RepID=A0ABP8X407_9ACTN
MRTTTPLRLLGVLGLLVAGVVVGTAAVLLHGLWWGFALALATGVASVLALPPGLATRVPFAGGWTLAVVVLMLPRAEGDYLVGGDLRGYGVLGFTAALLLLAMATVPARGRGASAGAADAAPPR